MVLLRRVSEDRELLKIIRRKKMNWLGHLMIGECLFKTAVEGKVKGLVGEENEVTRWLPI